MEKKAMELWHSVNPLIVNIIYFGVSSDHKLLQYVILLWWWDDLVLESALKISFQMWKALPKKNKEYKPYAAQIDGIRSGF